MDIDNSVGKARSEAGAGWREAKEGKEGTFVILSIIKTNKQIKQASKMSPNRKALGKQFHTSGCINCYFGCSCCALNGVTLDLFLRNNHLYYFCSRMYTFKIFKGKYLH